MKVAVLDLGSNTTKLLVAEVNDQAAPQMIAEESRACRLKEGGGESIRFPEKSIERILGILAELVKIARMHKVEVMKAVATEAFRKSENTRELIDLVQDSLGLSISVLSGSEEAGAIAAGLLTDPLISGLDDFHAIDIGGGSMEIIAVQKRKVTALESLPLGASVISERFCSDVNSRWTDSACRDAKNFVADLLHSVASSMLSAPCSSLVGSGGTLVFLRAILSGEAGVETKDKGSIAFSDSKALFERISQMTLDQRVSSYSSLPSSRADIFPGGLLVLNEVMSYFQKADILHSYHNLRHGIAMKLATELTKQPNSD